MLTTIIGLVIVLLAAFFVAWPMLQDAPAASEAPDSHEGTPEHEKEQALLAIREADFDHQTGKLSDEDHAALRAELEARALSAMAEIENASALHPVPPSAASTPAGAGASAAQPARVGPGGFCAACGVRFVRDARFCSGCGKKLPAAPQRGRRRA